MQHLRACRKGHDQAASSDAASAAAAAARHAWLRAGGVARRGVLHLSFVNNSISYAHAALESIAASKMHWTPFGMQQAIGADLQKSSPRFAWGRGTICMCYPVRQRCFDTCTRGTRPDGNNRRFCSLHFSAIGSRFKIRGDDRFYSTSLFGCWHVGGTRTGNSVPSVIT